MSDIKDRAFSEGVRHVPDNPVPAGIPADRAREWQGNDGHRDASRHARWFVFDGTDGVQGPNHARLSENAARSTPVEVAANQTVAPPSPAQDAPQQRPATMTA